MKDFFKPLFLAALFGVTCGVSAALSEERAGKPFVLVVEKLEGESEQHFYLENHAGRFSPLSVPEEMTDQVLKLGGRDVLVTGVASSAASLAPSCLDEPAPSPFSVNSIQSVAKAAVTTESVLAPGLRKIAFVLIQVGYGPNAAPPVFDESEIKSTFFSETYRANKIFEASSLGQISFSQDGDDDGRPDIFGPYAIPPFENPCNVDTAPDAYAQMGLARASVDGLDKRNFDHIVFVLPNSERFKCEWGGLGQMPGKFTWIATSYKKWNISSAQVIVHELGHNFGLNHAGVDPTGDPKDANSYGDWSCPMGNGYQAKIFNAAHSYQMGWVSSVEGAVQTLNNPGTYAVSIAPLENAGAGGTNPSIVRINVEGVNYILSYRKRVMGLSQVPEGFVAGVAITRDEGLFKNTALLATLRDGEQSTRLGNGVVIAQESHDANSVTVVVYIPAPPVVVEGTKAEDGAKEILGKLSARIAAARKAKRTLTSSERRAIVTLSEKLRRALEVSTKLASNEKVTALRRGTTVLQNAKSVVSRRGTALSEGLAALASYVKHAARYCK